MANAEIVRKIIQQGQPSRIRKPAASLINVLLGREQPSSAIEEEMIIYYAERSGEYNDWYERKNKYNKGLALNTRWFEDLNVVEEILTEIQNKNILEVAAGTGRWTKVLSKKNSVTPTDSSAEMLKINKSSTGISGGVFDVFSGIPERLQGRFSEVFCGFWLSHVPFSRINEFFKIVDQAFIGDQAQITILDS